MEAPLAGVDVVKAFALTSTVLMATVVVQNSTSDDIARLAHGGNREPEEVTHVAKLDHCRQTTN